MDTETVDLLFFFKQKTAYEIKAVPSSEDTTLNATCISPTSPSQHRGQLRLGIWIETASFLWMTVEAGVALTVGYMTRSISLQGFGIDSIIELITGGVLLWRLFVEQRNGSTEMVRQAERRASWVAAIGLFGLAAYIVADSAFTFVTRSHAEASW